jgi:hypothetical protein
VAHHVFRDENGDKLLAIVNRKGNPNKLGQDRGPPGPGLDDLSIAGFSSLRHFFRQVAVYKWTLF